MKRLLNLASHLTVCQTVRGQDRIFHSHYMPLSLMAIPSSDCVHVEGLVRLAGVGAKVQQQRQDFLVYIMASCMY